MKVLGDRVVVRPDPFEEQVASGLYLPQQVEDKSKALQSGVVLGVGPGVQQKGVLKPMDVAEGDRVVFPRYAGTAIHIEGEQYVVLLAEELVGTLNDEPQGSGA